ncbi:sensor histidine kinase [Nocardia camponoti]|uniref:sensor histidine kinase n=1 Tax=Nocardia camponoti TaxID=1616106 RepID=UPI0027E52DBC|nr:nitrate- and nitrite sensing domain-containing protein [Nocardia camponoti]
MAVGVGTAGYLIKESNTAKDWSYQLQAMIEPNLELVAAFQSERSLTLAVLAGDDSAAPALPAARTRVDTASSALNIAVQKARAVKGTDIGDDPAGFEQLRAGLLQVRGAADVGMIPVPDAYGFFAQVLDKFIVGSLVAALNSPNAEVAVGIIQGQRFLTAIESMSRSNSLATAIVAANSAPTGTFDEFVRQSGHFPTELALLAAELATSGNSQVATLLASPQYNQVIAMNNAIVARFANPAAAVKPAPLPMTSAEWHSATDMVSASLLDIYTKHNRAEQAHAGDVARQAEVTAALAGGGIVALSALVFLVAVILANRIIRRLRRLRTETLMLADKQLPATMQILRDGGDVDSDRIAPRLDFGIDEIGQVAKAFEHAAAAALKAAVDEARTREGVRAVFLNIAHRSQIVVHRQLEILDEAERRQEDPALLETLFRLDHLATRERRNAENLIILGGGRPGRQWRNPIPVMDVVRSAIGETLDYARVRVNKLPEVMVIGTVIADLVHLLAELVDNATAFSPPQSRVEASGNIVGKGVVIEITDQGMGMSDDDLAHYNEMLAAPPDFGVGTLSSDSRLGLFVVARLALAHGVTVRLSESDYGGIKAIVLVPTALLAGEADLPGVAPVTTGPLRRGLPPQAQLPAAPVAEASPSPVATLVAEPPTPAQDPVTPPAPQHFSREEERPALPRRNRQANLAPELSEDPTPTATHPAPGRPRTAEQARDIMSAIENGTRQGRKPLSNPNSDEQEG